MENEKQTSTEEVTVDVFTEEQLQTLPAETRNDIVFLEQKLPPAQIKALAPLINKMLKIKEYEQLEYKEGDKDQIDTYKMYKKDIAGFKKLIDKVKKEIKGPLDDMGKKVIAIEKFSKSFADEVLNNMAINWKPWEDAERKRLDALAEQRNKKQTEVINKLTEEQQLQANDIKKKNALNHIKYVAAQPYEQEVHNQIENYSLDGLRTLQAKLQNALATEVFVAFKNEVRGLINELIMSETEYQEAASTYQQKIQFLLKTVEDRMEFLRVQQENKTLQTREEAITSFGAFPVGNNAAPAEQPKEESGVATGSASVEETAQAERNSEPAQVLDDAKVFFANFKEIIKEYPDFTDVPFFEKSENGDVDIKKELANLSTKISVLIGQYTALYNYGLQRGALENGQYDEMKKISGTVILFKKILNYINS